MMNNIREQIVKFSRAGSLISVLGILIMMFGAYSVNYEYNKEIQILMDSLGNTPKINPPVIIVDTTGMHQLREEKKNLIDSISKLNMEKSKLNVEKDSIQRKYGDCIRQHRADSLNQLREIINPRDTILRLNVEKDSIKRRYDDCIRQRDSLRTRIDSLRQRQRRG